MVSRCGVLAVFVGLVVSPFLVVPSSACAQSARAASDRVANACTPGELLFSASYQPIDFQLSPDGRSLLVVDRGALSLRDPVTLEVQRYLLPRLDRWSAATYSPDGATITAETADDLRFLIRVADGVAERLPSRLTGPRESDEREGSWPMLSPSTHAARERLWSLVTSDPDTPTWTSMFEGSILIEREEGRELVVADKRGGLFRIDVPGRRLIASNPTSSDSPVTSLVIDGPFLITADVRGDVRVFDERLELVARAPLLPVLPQNVLRDAQGKALRALMELVPGGDRHRGDEDAKPPVRGLKRAIYQPSSKKLIWLSIDYELGVYDFEKQQDLVRLPAGSDETTASFLVGEGGLAMLTRGVLRRWDIAAQRVLWTTAGNYVDAIRLDDERLLASRTDGYGDIIDANSGKVLEQLCLLATPCAKAAHSPDANGSEQKTIADGKVTQGTTTQPVGNRLPKAGSRSPIPGDFRPDFESMLALGPVQLERSPDGRFFAAFQLQVISVERHLPAAHRLVLFDTRTLRPLATRVLAIEEGVIPNSSAQNARAVFAPNGKHLFFGGNTLSLPKLEPLGGGQHMPLPGDMIRQYNENISALAQGSQPHWLDRGSNKDFDTLYLGGGGIEAFATSDDRDPRGQQRLGTHIELSTDRKRFLIASSPLHHVPPPLFAVQGPAQIWCAPAAWANAMPARSTAGRGSPAKAPAAAPSGGTSQASAPTPSAYPPLQPLPPTSIHEGITVQSNAAMPGRIYNVVADAEDAWLLGEAPQAPRSVEESLRAITPRQPRTVVGLWHLTGAGVVTRLEIPDTADPKGVGRNNTPPRVTATRKAAGSVTSKARPGSGAQAVREPLRWQQVHLGPDKAVWLVKGDAVSRRDPKGGWHTSHSPGGDLEAFTPLAGERAAVAWRGPCSGTLEGPELEAAVARYYRHERHRFVKAAVVRTSSLYVTTLSLGKVDEARWKDWNARRKAAQNTPAIAEVEALIQAEQKALYDARIVELRAALGAPGADFNAIARRAFFDYGYHLESGSQLDYGGDNFRMTPFAQEMLQARPGDLLESVGKDRTSFVRVLDITPARLAPLEEVRDQIQRTLTESRDCYTFELITPKGTTDRHVVPVAGGRQWHPRAHEGLKSFLLHEDGVVWPWGPLKVAWLGGRWIDDHPILDAWSQYYTEDYVQSGGRVHTRVLRLPDGSKPSQPEHFFRVEGTLERPVAEVDTQRQQGSSPAEVVPWAEDRFQRIMERGNTSREAPELLELTAEGTIARRASLHRPVWLRLGDIRVMNAIDGSAVWLLWEGQVLLRFQAGDWSAWLHPSAYPVAVEKARRGP